MTLSYEQARQALNAVSLPAVVVDLDAFDRNLERHTRLVERGGLTLRWATKSIRVKGLIDRAVKGPGCRGLLCYSVAEAAQLARSGLDDLMVAYPTLSVEESATAAELTSHGVLLRLAVDSVEGVELLASRARRDAPIRVVLCVDMSLRAAGGKLHIGVRRSPLHTPEQVVELAERAREAGLSVEGLIGYEAQVAGLGDDSPFDHPVVRIAKRGLRALSMTELGSRRVAVVQALQARGFALCVVNGGGTGSLELTTRATGVTEVSAGSGLFKPLLFDGYRSEHVRSLEPACFFVLQAMRRPGPGMLTCLGGGYVASGAAGPDKLPRPYLPEGLELLDREGAGEVQTPVQGAAADLLPLGSAIVFRHAKAGEIMERFNEVVLVRGSTIVDRLRTYRGEGWCFG